MHQHTPQIQKSCFVFSGPLFACGWVYSTQNSTLKPSTLKPSTQGAAAPFQQHIGHVCAVQHQQPHLAEHPKQHGAQVAPSTTTALAGQGPFRQHHPRPCDSGGKIGHFISIHGCLTAFTSNNPAHGKQAGAVAFFSIVCSVAVLPQLLHQHGVVFLSIQKPQLQPASRNRKMCRLQASLEAICRLKTLTQMPRRSKKLQVESLSCMLKVIDRTYDKPFEVLVIARCMERDYQLHAICH